MNCILCLSRSANTKEHRIKGALFKKFFGNRHGIHFIKSEPTKAKIVQGPKSSALQFDQSNLCGDCNNKKSQAADKAFDKLDRLMQEEADKTNWRDDTLLPCTVAVDQDLIKLASKYFAKFLICKLHSSDYPIPEELR